MNKITQLTEKMQIVLGEKADLAGLESGMIRRKRKLTGSTFVQTMVLGKLSNPDASFEALSRTAGALGVSITAQGLEQRLDEKAAACLTQVLEYAVEEMLAANQIAVPLLEKFNGVYLQDSSVIGLPRDLVRIWEGCGNQKGKSAGLKIQVELSLSTGRLRGPFLQAGKDHDRSSRFQTETLPKGSLLIRDLGYWSLEEMDKRTQRGEFWLSRMRAKTKLTLENGKSYDLLDFLNAETGQRVDMELLLGERKIPARVLAIRLPQEVADKRKRQMREKAQSKGRTASQEALQLVEWYVLVTNVPEERLSLPEAIVLARARWQIELLFKLWKQSGKINKWHSKKPLTILCDCYSKLLAMIIQHWVILTAIWHLPNRSLVKAAQVVQSFTLAIAAVFHTPNELNSLLHYICRSISCSCKMNSRNSIPNTYQLLLNPALLDWEGLS